MKQPVIDIPSIDLDEVLNEYTTDPHFPRKVNGIVQSILKELSALQKTMELHSIRVGYIIAEDDGVATYIAESREDAIILLDARAHEEEARKDFITPERTLHDGLKSSIVHEMGHAYLDSKGLETRYHDEDVVENFARDYCDDGDDAKSIAILNDFIKRS